MRSLKENFWINFGVRSQSQTHGLRFIDVGTISLQTAVWHHILCQHHNPQQWSNQNRPHTRSSYEREDHRDGRTHAVRQIFVS